MPTPTRATVGGEDIIIGVIVITAAICADVDRLDDVEGGGTGASGRAEA